MKHGADFVVEKQVKRGASFKTLGYLLYQRAGRQPRSQSTDGTG